MEYIKTILGYLSDQSIMGFFQIVKAEYLILATLIAPPILWLIKRFTGWTPWKSDDDLADKVAQRIGLGKSNG